VVEIIHEVITLVKEVGFPIAVAFALMWAAWRIIEWIGSRADKIIDRSIAGLDAVASSMSVQTEILKSIQHSQGEHGAILARLDQVEGVRSVRFPEVLEDHDGGRCPGHCGDSSPTVSAAR